MDSSVIIAIVIIVALVVLSIVAGLAFRRVVPTNMVHIVQSRKATTSYGTSMPNGNVCYSWPSPAPVFGVTVIELPVSNFDILLHDYDAYDIDRVPFRVDVVAFFRMPTRTSPLNAFRKSKSSMGSCCKLCKERYARF